MLSRVSRFHGAHPLATHGLAPRHICPGRQPDPLATSSARGRPAAIRHPICRSDQPKKEKAHSAAWHVQVLRELVLALDLRSVVLVGHDDGARLGLAVAQAEPAR